MSHLPLDKNAVLMVISIVADNLGRHEDNRASNLADIIDGFEERMDPELRRAEVMQLYKAVSAYLADLNRSYEPDRTIER
jgi:pyruvate-formate lyase